MAEAAKDAAGFEARLKEAPERELVGKRMFEAAGDQGLWVELVQLDGTYPDAWISVVIRDDTQPDCRFSWGGGEVWDHRAFAWPGPEPEDRTWELAMCLQEDLDASSYGMPLRCSPGAIVPIKPHVVTLDEAIRQAAERLRQRGPDAGWERVDREVLGDTWTMWLLEAEEGKPFTLWPPMKPARSVGATYPGFLLYLQTDFLPGDAPRRRLLPENVTSRWSCLPPGRAASDATGGSR